MVESKTLSMDGDFVAGEDQIPWHWVREKGVRPGQTNVSHGSPTQAELLGPLDPCYVLHYGTRKRCAARRRGDGGRTS